LRHHVDIWLTPQEGREAGPEQVVVIDDQDADGSASP
jgi:hypothetical protein